ncbi:hypothetical protein C8R45DRAFT_937653 [Mycena sanguinolenta]|nr:hypothetical protein C8R45DRAFT_937653 [Mycena sanguinolenta]
MHRMVDVVDGGARLNVDCDSEEEYKLTAAWLTMTEERSAETVVVVKVKEIRTTAKYLAQPYFERFLPHIKGNIGFVCTQSDLKEVPDLITTNKVATPTRAGAFAPKDVTIPAGNTEMEPSKTFQALGTRGSPAVVVVGTCVGQSEAALLNMLNFSPFTYGMNVVKIFDNLSSSPSAASSTILTARCLRQPAHIPRQRHLLSLVKSPHVCRAARDASSRSLFLHGARGSCRDHNIKVASSLPNQDDDPTSRPDCTSRAGACVDVHGDASRDVGDDGGLAMPHLETAVAGVRGGERRLRLRMWMGTQWREWVFTYNVSEMAPPSPNSAISITLVYHSAPVRKFQTHATGTALWITTKDLPNYVEWVQLQTTTEYTSNYRRLRSYGRNQLLLMLDPSRQPNRGCAVTSYTQTQPHLTESGAGRNAVSQRGMGAGDEGENEDETYAER